MTISTIPLKGGEDALGRVEMDNAQLQIEPRTLLVEDLREFRATALPDRYLANNRVIREVLLPSTLRTIGANVFSRMESLDRLDLSETQVESIGIGFLFCTESVQSCRFPRTLQTLGFFSLFRTSIKHVDLSHTLLTELPQGFLSCSPLEVLLVPPTLEAIMFYALQATRLRRLDCSHTRLRWICDCVLSYSPLLEVRVPSTVDSIAFSAFQYTQVRKVWVGEKEIQWVNEHLLNSEVRELRVPSCILGIYDGALSNTQLQRVDLSDARILNVQHYFLCDNPCLEEVLLPGWLTSISHGFLCNNPKFKSLDLRGTRVEHIGDDFLFGTPIEEIWFPDTLNRVGKRFLLGAKVATVDLSKTRLTSIGTDFLQKCDQLQSLLLPQWVIDIPDNLPCPGRTAEGIVLPPAIGLLGTLPFQRAPFLRLMDLSETAVVELPDKFLSEAPNLMDVRFPKLLKFIQHNVFARTALRKVNLLHTKIHFIGIGFCEFSPLKRLCVPESYFQERPELVRVIRRPSSHVYHDPQRVHQDTEAID